MIKSRLVFLSVVCTLVLALPVSAQKNRHAKTVAVETEKKSDLSEKQLAANTATFVNAVKERLCGNYDAAMDSLYKVLSVEPDHHAAYYELAILLIQKGRVSDAIPYAEQASRLDSKNSWYKVLLGEAYNQAGILKKGEYCWKELSEAYPENLDYLNNYAYSLIQQNKFKEALLVYDNMEKQLGVNEQLIDTKKSIYLFLNNVDAAVKEVKKLTVAYPSEAKHYLQAASIYLNNDMKDKAIPYLKEAQRLDPENAQLQVSLYEYYSDRKNHEESYAYMKKIFSNPDISVQPKKDVMQNYMRSMLDNPSRYESEADELSAILVKTHPNDAGVLSMRADVLISQQRADEALPVLDSLLLLDSSRYVTWNCIISILLKTDAERAGAMGARASELFPAQSMPYLAQAVRAYYRNDYENALSYLEDASMYAGEDEAMWADIYNLQAATYYAMGDKDKANEAARQSYEHKQRMAAFKEGGKTRKR